MILPPHASLLRLETIRLLLASGHERTQVADMFGVTRQAVYSSIERFDLMKPLAPLSRQQIADAPYLKLSLAPDMAQRLVDARIIETLLGVKN